jgi:hypothetical protein
MYAEGNHEVYLTVGVSHQGITHEFFSINYKLHLQVWINWAHIHTKVEKKLLLERLSWNYISSSLISFTGNSILQVYPLRMKQMWHR